MEVDKHKVEGSFGSCFGLKIPVCKTNKGKMERKIHQKTNKQTKRINKPRALSEEVYPSVSIAYLSISP